MKHNTSASIIDVKKYGGRQVAIIDGKIVASGATLTAVLSHARKKAPQRAVHEIKIFSVPKSAAIIYGA